ncbi:uncharacterized protein PHACADRAFT_206833 [Phanerochaete carnosa HHB-10118-sp]|uniref:RRM domain-containing protein n=1 Tax=Phanerochaete carnosa (strain HHB-10118-sp) TaxID=650164 RepID=K5V5N8_PHACS|nr:uncharacterized protein PHACADRAFT_206833 [Phanerochaete carnosa HHB-10118-sp]EKM57986.1 hypothetical protein PHACADRAFT_206833 [Phanerochaete carnosa HHB-10118-sp]
MTLSSPNPVFRFHGEPYSVKVENVAHTVTRQDLVTLFTTLIGDISNCTEYQDEKTQRVFELAFTNPDASKKALCMLGYNIAGVPLVVSESFPIDSRRQGKHGSGRLNDSRRNLYVLGLPFDLTKLEFTDLFSRYGTVSHAVILATVDNASRRRGFIVMSTHQESKAAMDGLSRKEIKGHTIDISWAVVQRSGGFLDGGDRTMVLSQQNNSGASGPASDYDMAESIASPETPAICTPPMDCNLQSLPVPTLLVTNLPTMLFSQDGDLYPLLCPFGEIVQLRVLNRSTDTDTLSVSVEYKTMAQAREAKELLDGQLYHDRHVKAEFLLPEPSSPVASDFSTWSTTGGNNKPRLNPYAPPFKVQTGIASDTSGGYNPFRYQVQDCYGSDDDFAPGRRWSGCSTPLHALASSRSQVYSRSGLLAPPLATYRPHSAPSDPNKGAHFRPGNWTSSSQDYTSLSSVPFSAYST